MRQQLETTAGEGPESLTPVLRRSAKCAAPRRTGSREVPEGGCLSDAASPGRFEGRTFAPH